jgi:stage V sporulation protein R
MNQVHASYSLEDLQVLDDKCLQEALALGLSPPDTMFHLVESEEMYDIAARGLPGRFSHYQFGRSYEQQKGDYDRGKGRIYELVINTKPAHAYLLDGNSFVSQFFVMAHVYGHTDFFEHNRYFEPADKNILTRTRAAAERIDFYIGEHGRAAVENFIDSCQAFEYNKDWDQLAKRPSAKAPVWEDNKFDTLFPEEEKKRREEHVVAKEDFKRRFPKAPERDILRFIERHATHLDDWQRDVISIIRTEAEYFVPQGRTQVMNEGWAVRAHNHIVQTIMAKDDTFDTDDYLEYEAHNALVLHPKIATKSPPGDPNLIFHCIGINPYLLGSLMWKDIARICVKPTDEEREKWESWAGKVDPIEFLDEIHQVYDDRVFISEFLSPKLCEQAKIFRTPRIGYKAYKDLRIQKEEFEWVRAFLVDQKTNLGVPYIEITDANFGGRGELYLEHRWEGQFEILGLDDEYARGTTELLLGLWGRPVNIRTIITEAHEEEEWGLNESGRLVRIFTPKIDDVWYRGSPVNRAATKSHTPPS